jgi:hypothetical protein
MGILLTDLYISLFMCSDLQTSNKLRLKFTTLKEVFEIYCEEFNLMFCFICDKLIKTGNTFNFKIEFTCTSSRRDLSNLTLRLIGKNLSAGRRH